MNYSILQRAGEVTLEPFPHLVIDPCLPAELYDELEATRPSDETIVQDSTVRGTQLGSNVRTDLHAIQLLARPNLPKVWREFIVHHLSHDFWEETVLLFGEGIRKMHVGLEDKFSQPLASIPTYTRFTARVRNALSMDVNVGVNTPATSLSRVRGPHVDNAVELFAAMLYMAPRDALDEGGDFVVYAETKPVRFEYKAEVRRDDEQTLREVLRVPYRRNVMVAFINSLHSVHGVTSRRSDDYRRLVNFCIELPFSAFNLVR